MKKFVVAALGAVAFTAASSPAFALTSDEAFNAVVAACAGNDSRSCTLGVQDVVSRIGAFDNRNAIGRAIARAAEQAGAEDTVDAALGSTLASNDPVVSGFDGELGTAATGGDGFGGNPGDGGGGAPQTTADTGGGTLGGEGFGDGNDNDGGEGSAG